MPLHRRDILNMCSVAIGANSYLEIGVRNPAVTFNHIWAKQKVGVDPYVKGHPAIRAVTSDAFFEGEGKNRNWDLIFVDGYHSLAIVARDVYNALDSINEGGIVAMHDVNPTTPRQATPWRHLGPWCGEVWRVFVECRTRSDLDCITIMDGPGPGVGLIVKRSNTKLLNISQGEREQLTYADLAQHRHDWLRLVRPRFAVTAIRRLTGLQSRR